MSEGCPEECPHVGFLCGLGFLRAWWPQGSQTWDLKAQKCKGKCFGKQPFIPSPGGHLHHLLLVRGVIDPSTVKGREASPSV